MCDRIGAIPAPPPMNTISALVSFAKNSPNGPYTITLSPGFRLNVQLDILPGGNPSVPRRRRCHADVEFQHASLVGIIRHRIGAGDHLVRFRAHIEETETFPIRRDIQRQCRNRCISRRAAGIRAVRNRLRESSPSRLRATPSTSSLMNVATLSFETTEHSQRLTPRNSCGTSIFRSCFTATWHPSRQPSRTWRLLR